MNMATSTADARKAFSACVLFRGLAQEELTALISRAHVKQYAPGETIFLMGSPGDSMMAVLSGSIRISIPSPEGKEIVLTVLHPGEILGEIALLDGKGRSADARAMNETSYLAVLNRRDVMSFLDRHPRAWSALVEVLCERLRRTDEQFIEVAFLQVPIRLAKAMLRLTDQHTDAKLRSEIHLSQRELGSMIGATRESVNKCLGDWQQRGVVRIEGSAIKIRNREALDDLAELTDVKPSFD
jgi:CRP/FNR family transcriptional regulator, cyclic AMP receptor protein